MRLDQLEMGFEGKAIRDRHVAAGTLMVKIAEHRATLLGLNPRIGHVVVQHESLAAKHFGSMAQYGGVRRTARQTR